MAKRIKKTDFLLLPIHNWQEADELIKRLGDLTNQIAAVEASAKEQIDKIKADLIEVVKPLEDSIILHTQSLEAYAAAHQDDFGKQKSRKLNFGTLGWRASSEIIIGKRTIENIKAVFATTYKKYLRIKETVNKVALKQLTDEQLADIEARREDKEVFFVEPDQTEYKSQK